MPVTLRLQSRNAEHIVTGITVIICLIDRREAKSTRDDPCSFNDSCSRARTWNVGFSKRRIVARSIRIQTSVQCFVKFANFLREFVETWNGR